MLLISRNYIYLNIMFLEFALPKIIFVLRHWWRHVPRIAWQDLPPSNGGPF
jgi:hypothetical protein